MLAQVIGGESYTFVQVLVLWEDGGCAHRGSESLLNKWLTFVLGLTVWNLVVLREAAGHRLDIGGPARHLRVGIFDLRFDFLKHELDSLFQDDWLWRFLSDHFVLFLSFEAVFFCLDFRFLVLIRLLMLLAKLRWERWSARGRGRFLSITSVHGIVMWIHKRRTMQEWMLLGIV